MTTSPRNADSTVLTILWLSSLSPMFATRALAPDGPWDRATATTATQTAQNCTTLSCPSQLRWCQHWDANVPWLLWLQIRDLKVTKENACLAAQVKESKSVQNPRVFKKLWERFLLQLARILFTSRISYTNQWRMGFDLPHIAFHASTFLPATPSSVSEPWRAN